MKKIIYTLSLSALALFNFPVGASVNEEHEKQLTVSPKTLQELDAFIKDNQKRYLNKVYVTGDILINLVPTDPIHGGKVLRNTQTGVLRTEYTVPDNYTFKLVEVRGQIAPQEESIKRPRMERLAGDGYAKETSKGVLLATLNLKKGTPIAPGIFSVPVMSLSEDYARELSRKQEERKPESARNQIPHPQKSKTAYKPTKEEMEILKKQKEQFYRADVEKWTDRFNEISLENISGEEADKLAKTVNFSLKLIDTNINKNDLMVDQCIKSLEKSIVRLEQIQAETIKSQNLEDSSPSLSSVSSSDTSLRDIKKSALEKIKIEEEKEKLKRERPNANPNPINEDDLEKKFEEGNPLPVNKVGLYKFLNQVPHSIIKILRETTNADSSFEGVIISRAELKNFVKELENLERSERLASLEGIKENDNASLGYSYKESEGKGSHTKVKFGKGTKPFILSKQGEHKLTIPQLKDLKEILIEKGLIHSFKEE